MVRYQTFGEEMRNVLVILVFNVRFPNVTYLGWLVLFGARALGCRMSDVIGTSVLSMIRMMQRNESDVGNTYDFESFDFSPFESQ